MNVDIKIKSACGRDYLAINGIAVAMQGDVCRDPEVLILARKLRRTNSKKYCFVRDGAWDVDTFDAAIELIGKAVKP